MKFGSKKRLAAAATIVAASVSGVAQAVPPTTVAELATAVSFSDVALAILAVSGTLITLFVTWKGAKFVLRAVKGG